MADATETQTTETQTPIVEKDAAYWQAEARKAFQARDEEKAKRRDLEARAVSDDDIKELQTLREERAKAEEERQKKAGEWEALDRQRNEKFERERKAWTEKEQQLAAEKDATLNELKREMIAAAFGSAPDLFGGHERALTILKPSRAQQILGEHVDVETSTVNGRTVRKLVVKDIHGEIIYDTKTRQPQEFGVAMRELIESLPDADDILRGSGKTGGGSSGGINGGAGGQKGLIDASTLTPEQRRDPKIIAQLKAQRPRGGPISGRAYQ